MIKLKQTSKKERIDNYRIEKYKTDKYGNSACVQIECYLSNDNSNLNTYGGIVRHLNGLCGSKRLELDEYGLDLMFWIEIPESIIDKKWGYCVIGCKFNMEGISHHLDELVYDVLTDAIIDIYDDCKLDVVNK